MRWIPFSISSHPKNPFPSMPSTAAWINEFISALLAGRELCPLLLGKVSKGKMSPLNPGKPQAPSPFTQISLECHRKATCPVARASFESQRQQIPTKPSCRQWEREKGREADGESAPPASWESHFRDTPWVLAKTKTPGGFLCVCVCIIRKPLLPQQCAPHS